MKRNPKQVDSVLFDCIPQQGSCPIGCNQCFYNRPNAFYVPIDQSHFPTLEEVGDGIVRVNCGNDSNNDREYVIESTSQYPRRFFNTSIPKFDFPGPVVLTGNPKEEEMGYCPYEIKPPRNLMFVRLRISSTNLELIRQQVVKLSDWLVPVVFTFMAYYDAEPLVPYKVREEVGEDCYEYKVRHINNYWCPTKAFVKYVMDSYRGNNLVSLCGSFDGPFCLLCRNCETYYIQTMKRLRGE